MKQVEYTEEEARRIEEGVDQQMRDKAEREQRYREARRERIAAGKPDWTDCSNELEIVCPHCGAWQEGSILPLQQLTPGQVASRHFELTCPSCKQNFGCEASVKFAFTTFLFEIPESDDATETA